MVHTDSSKEGTAGFFENVYNPTSGVIGAINLRSPQNQIITYNPLFNEGLPPPHLPDLRRWSDVTKLEWVRQCEQAGSNPANLRYKIDSIVTTPSTTAVIRVVLGHNGHDITPRWPGVTVNMLNADGSNNQDGEAMLGTPHGSKLTFMPFPD